MDVERPVLLGVAASVALNAAISVATDTATLLATTPVGVAVYLVVGVGAPQALAARNGDIVALGAAVLALLAAAAVLVVGFLFGGLLSPTGSWFLNMLFVVVFGGLFTALVRRFSGDAAAR